jgi:hypothetical protein
MPPKEIKETVEEQRTPMTPTVEQAVKSGTYGRRVRGTRAVRGGWAGSTGHAHHSGEAHDEKWER